MAIEANPNSSCSAPLLQTPDILLWQVHARDNVAVALQQLDAGLVLNTASGDIRLPAEVPAGHKFALTALTAGDSVIKYGYAIGVLTQDVPAGGHIHSHNLKISTAV